MKMHPQNVFDPIVVAKPVRGREMRTKVIPKETMKAMKVVSTKTLKDESSMIENNKIGDYPEIYHEGYIDGKLFLVPDSNLQAMRDIVNKKMKRRPSGNKPHQFVDETTNYSELVTKFDNLLDKLDQFAESSSEDLNTSENKHLRQKRKKSLKKPDLFNLQKETPEDDKNSTSLKEDSENKNKFESVDEDETKSKNSDILPPFLNEKIKYKRVKQNISNPSTENISNQNILETRQFTDFDSNNWNHPIKDPEYEVFRFLISGHFKNESSPNFIIHQNYIGPNVLENYMPDFKSHKKEGNVHVFITGKFFTNDILVNETISSAAALSIPPYIIPINSNNSTWNEKFRGVYSLGPVEIAIEGEFIQDKETLQYTPIISLDIVKPEPIINTSKVIPTAVLYSKQSQKSPFEDNDDSDKTKKHVHYAKSENTEFNDGQSNEQEKEKFTWESMKKVVKKIAMYNLFLKNTKGSNSDIASIDDSRVSSDQENKLLPPIVKMKRGSLLKQRFRGKKGQRRRSRILEDIREEKLIESKAETNFAPIQDRKGSVERKLSLKRDSTNKKDSIIKKKKKGKKEDKNQAIVENPILAQMQEFFIV